LRHGPPAILTALDCKSGKERFFKTKHTVTFRSDVSAVRGRNAALPETASISFARMGNFFLPPPLFPTDFLSAVSVRARSVGPFATPIQ